MSIANGSRETLVLGNMDVARDWGWAPEYVEAMWLMLQQETVDDYIVATGVTHTLQEFVEAAFLCVDLDWHDHVRSDPSLFRPADIRRGSADPTKVKTKLGWQARKNLKDVVAGMVQAEDRNDRQ